MTRKSSFALGLLLCLSCWNAVSAEDNQTTNTITPPVVNWRDISITPRLAFGERIDFGTSTVLFLPEGWEKTIGEAGSVKLTMHYHGAIWYAIEEHARRGATNPFIAFYPGEGSSTYGRLYPTREPFDEQLTSVTVELNKRYHGKAPAFIENIELESFSAGYGAIREILQWPDVVQKTSAVVLADSLYSSAVTEAGERVPDPVQIKPFIDFARLAAEGKKKMVVAHSSIEIQSYCSTVETANAILRALNISRTQLSDVPPPAASPNADFPLTSRGDSGNLHVWQYAGNPAKAHSAIARAVADYWKAIN